VTGTVTHGGKPVAEAAVVFQPVAGGPSPAGQTDASGKYSLTTFVGGDGAPAGEYKVGISKYEVPPDPRPNLPEGEEEPKNYREPPPPKSLLPQFENPENSGLTAKVTEAGPNTIDFNL
jgi:hypothetical protein